MNAYPWWADITPVLIVGAMEVSSYHQHKDTYGLGRGLIYNYAAVVLLSDFDFVALINEHIFSMRWHHTRVNSKRDGSISNKKHTRCGLGYGFVYN